MAKKIRGRDIRTCGALIVLLYLVGAMQSSKVLQRMYESVSQQDEVDATMPTISSGVNITIPLAGTRTSQASSSSDIKIPIITENQKIASRSALEDALEETTRLLYKNSPHLDKWLSRPFPTLYVYDTLPKNWSDIPTISKCIESKLLDKPGYKNCLWEPKEPCDDTENPKNMFGRKCFMNYRANYNNDVAYVPWFQNYPGKTTANASEADLFVVPYPHWSHCICQRNMSLLATTCPYSVEVMKREVLDNLAFYEEQKDRHLFFLGVDWQMVRPAVRNQLVDSMTISLGPTCPPGQPSSLCGHFVTPYVDTLRAYQPQTIQQLSLEWWTTRNRTFALGAAVSTREGFHERIELIVNQSTHLGDSVGGLPLRLLDLMDQRRQVSQYRLQGIYNESVFCPILPGDACPQKRFFDVILNGCIPIVPTFTPSDDEDFPTFFRREGSCSIRRTYPWSRGTFFGDNKTGVDYLSLVVQYDGVCGIPCMKPAMEQVMRNSTELTRLRTNLRDYARLVAFGLGRNRYKGVDGFSAMLVAIRHYLFHLGSSSTEHVAGGG